MKHTMYILLVAAVIGGSIQTAQAAPSASSQLDPSAHPSAAVTKAADPCVAVKKSKKYRSELRRARRTGGLEPAVANRVYNDTCRTIAGTVAQRQRVWNAALDQAVSAGLLTGSDRVALRPVVVQGRLAASWNPTTDFGRQIHGLASTDDPRADASTGLFVGGVLGGIIGFAAAGPAGIAAGIAVGAAAGDLVETLVTLEEDSGDDEGGDEDDG